MGGNSNGFYSINAQVEQQGSFEVLRVVRDKETGYIKSAYVPGSSEDTPIKLTLSESYTGDGTPMKMFLKKITVRAGDSTFTLSEGAEISSETAVTIYVPTSEKTKLPYLLGNKLEDSTESYEGSYELLSGKDLWSYEEKEATYGGVPITLTPGVPLRNVEVSFDNIVCPVANGILQYPCSGSIDYENGVITAAIDSSYLNTHHSKGLTVADYFYNGLLSESVVPGTVSVSGGKVSLVDDGNGNLVGNGGSGTIDYQTGHLTLNLDSTSFENVETEETVNNWIPYKQEQSLNLDKNIKPMSFKMEVLDSVDPNSGKIVATCADDGYGNLIGACKGTINYSTGQLTFKWDDSVSEQVNSGTISITYSYITYEPQPLSLTVSWESQDKNLSLHVSYEKYEASNAKTTYFFSTPGDVEEVKVFEGSKEVNASVFTYPTTYGDLVKVVLPEPPRDTVTAYYVSDRKFDFNPSVTVEGKESYSFPVTIEIEAELESGETVSKTITAMATAFTKEE